MYDRTTRSILVTAKPIYLENESEPDEGRFFWAYTISIENCGQETVQLLTRHWQITDAHWATSRKCAAMA